MHFLASKFLSAFREFAFHLLFYLDSAQYEYLFLFSLPKQSCFYSGLPNHKDKYSESTFTENFRLPRGISFSLLYYLCYTPLITVLELYSGSAAFFLHHIFQNHPEHVQCLLKYAPNAFTSSVLKAFTPSRVSLRFAFSYPVLWKYSITLLAMLLYLSFPLHSMFSQLIKSSI